MSDEQDGFADEEQLTPVGSISSVVEEESDPECDACHPPDPTRQWRDVHAWEDPSRDVFVVAPIEHTMEVTPDTLEHMLELARSLRSEHFLLRFDSLDLPDHFHAYLTSPIDPNRQDEA